MSLLAHTTDIPEYRTIAEIQKLLSEAKAIAILQEFNGAGDIEAISFRISTQFGPIQYKLPANVPGVDAALKEQYRAKKIDRRYANDSRHSRRVAWRIIRHWLEAQLSLIASGMAKPEQVFLPYAQDAKGKTVFEALSEQKFRGLALPAPEKTS